METVSSNGHERIISLTYQSGQWSQETVGDSEQGRISTYYIIEILTK